MNTVIRHDFRALLNSLLVGKLPRNLINHRNYRV
jgi:hypothetical protein